MPINKIITVTLNPSLDVSLYPESFVYDEPNRVEREHIDAGGKGVNVSRVLTSLGVGNTAYAVTGDENLSSFRRLLHREGVELRPVVNIGKIRENMTITLPDGGTIKLNRRGGEVSDALMDELGKQILAESGVGTLAVFGGSLPVGVDKTSFCDFMRWIAGGGVKIAVDNSELKMSDYISLRPMIIKPNEPELAAIVGRELREPEEIAVALQPLCGKVEHILVSLGGRGIMRVTERGYILAKPPEVAVVTTVGAGDTALAGYIAALSGGACDEECLRFAAACGTASVTLDGTGVITKSGAEKILPQVEVSSAEI